MIRFPFTSNFTDVQPLDRAGVSFRYVSRPEQIGNPDFLILPGSKNVRHDADFLRRTALDRVLRAAAARGIPMLGICGGFQILGRTLRDPHGVEGAPGETAGLDLLPLDTVLEREKELCRVDAENIGLPFLPPGEALRGYEIHMGRTRADGEGRALSRTSRKNGAADGALSGFVSPSGLVFGGYLHGLFDEPRVREGLFQWLCARKGLDWRGENAAAAAAVADPLDRIADLLEAHLDPAALLS